eukprot:GILK01008175.1.p1 GENE.GILK01008175.1~~GILK01008175.1.p1  ORF type:complete len:465 (+),score=80.39 GILK01008175.1:63-1457(+)
MEQMNRLSRSKSTIMDKTLEKKLRSDRKLIIVMIGLPARGKSYIAKKLQRYLNWMGYSTSVFNVGNRRREQLDSTVVRQDFNFFNPDNADMIKLREQIALDTLHSAIRWLHETTGQVVIFDATNTTRARRDLLREQCEKAVVPCQILFVESICTDPDVLEVNIQMKLNSPDYRKMDPAEASRDFRHRLEQYEKVYETITEEEEEHSSYIKLINVGRKIIAHAIYGYLPAQIVTYLMNMHISPRCIWLAPPGETFNDAKGRMGGESELTSGGARYAQALAQFAAQRASQDSATLSVWISTSCRSEQTAHFLSPMDSIEIVSMRVLDDLNVGACDSLTKEECAQKFPQEYAAWERSRFTFRFPGRGGESYVDVIQRLKAAIIELERLRSNVLVIADIPILRCLYAYFIGASGQECLDLELNLNEVVELKPTAYGCDVRRFNPESEIETSSDQQIGSRRSSVVTVSS